MAQAKVRRQVVEVVLSLTELQDLALGRTVEIIPDHGDQQLIVRGSEL